MKWKEARQKLTEKARKNFENQETKAMGVEEELAHLDSEYKSIERDLYQQTLENLGNLPGINLKYEEDSPWEDTPVMAHVNDEYFEEELKNIDGFFPDEGFFPESYDNVVAEISYDLSNELEKATGVNIGLEAAHNEREMMDKIEKMAIPDNTDLYRVGHVPEMMLDEVEGFYNRKNFENGEENLENFEDYMTQKRRYYDHIKSHGPKVMAIGGTDSIQLTMAPKYDGDVDEMVKEFTGNGKIGAPALSPLMYAPFMSSPVLDEDGELVKHMGRDDAYEIGLGDSEYVDNEGTSKFGYIPELSEVEDLEDMTDALASKKFQFSAGVPADELKVKGDERSLYEKYGEKHEQIDPDTSINVRVGHEDYGVIDFKDFVEDRKFEGLVSLPGTNGEDGDEVIVEADYTDKADEEFTDELWGHFIAHSSGVWPSFRPRYDIGAFESRDFGNSPRIKEAIDTQGAFYMKWDEVQELADEIGLKEEHAEKIRQGIAEEGLEYEISEDLTVRDVWKGREMERGVLDILEEGVKEAAYDGEERITEEDREKYAEEYREKMEEYLEKGSFSKEFAETYRNKGLDAAMEKTRV